MPYTPNMYTPAPQSRIVCIVLLVISLVCVGVYANESENGPLHTLQSFFTGITVPATATGSAIGAGVIGLEDAFDNATADDDTLTGLRQKVAELTEQLVEAEELRQENERLQKLLVMKNTYSIQGVSAQVIGRSTESYSQTVTINAGTSDGVVAGQTVVGSTGVVGQVSSTSEHSSVVRLLTDPNSGVSVLIQSNRAQGILLGSLDGLLYLEAVDSSVEVQIGDVIITSGLGGSFARGLIVGTVVKIDDTNGQALRRIVVAPNESASALQELMVVTGMSSSNG